MGLDRRVRPAGAAGEASRIEGSPFVPPWQRVEGPLSECCVLSASTCFSALGPLNPPVSQRPSTPAAASATVMLMHTIRGPPVSTFALRARLQSLHPRPSIGAPEEAAQHFGGGQTAKQEAVDDE